MHQQPIVPGHGTQYGENPSTHHGGMHEDELTDWTPISYYTNLKGRCLLISLSKQQVSSLLDTSFFLFIESKRPRVVKCMTSFL